MVLFVLASLVTAGKLGKAVSEGGVECANKTLLISFFF